MQMVMFDPGGKAEARERRLGLGGYHVSHAFAPNHCQHMHSQTNIYCSAEEAILAAVCSAGRTTAELATHDDIVLKRDQRSL